MDSVGVPPPAASRSCFGAASEGMATHRAVSRGAGAQAGLSGCWEK
eukprot:CAMPEP_0195105850 /NCGR_PEP_ID=MMETSP0448-20130528/78176_1 /TAXON_ID=66468 /ORGANISM="Heterocapsa triquestra, Strain CCMP 448" /LENGTH=45 /DNA_ID= /DNA_START= /DNA_END= /DNA_ORIENTATION=